MAKPDNEAEGPQTGDNSNIALWMTVLFVSGIVLLGMLKVKRKSKWDGKASP
ncbi:MAG: sortase B protein-sorting domain-containing protein [Clostridia bacterium]